MGNDRPPILGVVGRTSGQIRLTVCENTQKDTIQPQVEYTLSRRHFSIPMRIQLMTRSIKQAEVMLLSVIQRMNGQEMMMEMVSGKSIVTH